MTEKFDPKATPECDLLWRHASHFPDHTEVILLVDAQELERNARIAEEKLRIAVEGFNNISDMEDIVLGGYSFEALMARDILKEIEGVGK
jgi:hypothetical protein